MFASKLQNFNRLYTSVLTHLTSSRGFHAGAINLAGINQTTNIDIDFKSMHKYKQKYGHLIVPKVYDLGFDSADVGPQSGKFGSHADYIRKIAKHFPWRISPDDLVKLNKMEFSWHIDNDRFRRTVLALVHYRELYGNTKVAYDYEVLEGDDKWPLSLQGERLGRRLCYISQQKPLPWKLEFMESVGITPKDLGIPSDILSFTEKERANKSSIYIDFYNLQKYKNIYGDLEIPSNFSFEEDDKKDIRKLGNHTKKIRFMAKYYPWRISTNHLAKLNEMGFLWDYNDEMFGRTVLALVHYRELYGNTLVPVGYVVPEDDEAWPIEMQGEKLGEQLHWIRKHELTPKQLEYMESLGISDKGWLEQRAAMLIEALTIYKKVHKISEKKVFTVPKDFIIPSAEPWPQHLWEMPFGSRISGVRTEGRFQEYHEEFRSLGLDFNVQRRTKESNDSAENTQDKAATSLLLHEENNDVLIKKESV